MKKIFNNAAFLCENPDPEEIPALSKEQIEQFQKDVEALHRTCCVDSIHTMPGPTTSTSRAYKYCQNCNTKMEELGEWWYCPKCGYGHMDYIGDSPQQIEIPTTIMAKGWNEAIFPTATAIGKQNADPDTLIIERCSKLQVEHNGIEIEFPLDNNILKSIDTIEINGFKYVKEND